MKLTLFSKLMIAVLFSGICLTGVYLHSEKWNSLIDGISFLVTDYFVYETERFNILEMLNLIVLPTLSLLFLLLPFKWTNTIIILLMCIYCLMILPWNYIEDSTLSF
ncbi:hypothetical protein [Fluviicola sp.]|uniref:hypothetical protein n=1 Tax=Fluviicola sp. TaxID=1917219 RepID=UPI00261ED95B|nr:hypothetical protein [Fluviicola sp.]